MNDYIVKSLIELIFTLLAATITTVLLPALSSWLRSKTQNEQIKAIIADVTTTVATCVDHCEQTIVQKLKSEDKWNETTQKEVLTIVSNNVVDSLMRTTKSLVEKNGIDLQEIIEQHIEAYIQSKKDVL